MGRFSKLMVITGITFSVLSNVHASEVNVEYLEKDKKHCNVRMISDNKLKIESCDDYTAISDLTEGDELNNIDINCGCKGGTCNNGCGK
jgi:hypothetical protein